MIYISEINITSLLVYAINNMLSNMLSSINENVLDLLDKLAFINSDITKSLTSVIGTHPYSGINLICNSLIYGFLIYYAISFLLSHLTFSQVENPIQFVFKLLLCAFALNASHMICSGLIFICSHISSMILDLGDFLFGYDISFSSFIKDILPNDYFTSNSFSLFSFDGLIKAATSFGFLSLTISYAIRYILIKVLVIIAPFAILSLSSSKTSPFFKSWLKNFIATLFLQIFISIILLVCFIVDDRDKILPSQIMHIGMIYTLIKANSFMKEFLGGFSTDVNLSFPSISSIFKGGVFK